jgi:hypothetical protein
VYAGVAARHPGLDARAERAAVALGQALEKRGALDLGSPPLPDTGGAPDGALAGLVAAGRAKYLEGDFNAALDKADDAIERFEATGAFRSGSPWASWGAALVIRALALRRLGKEADADAALARLASVMPSAVPDPEITPPKIAQRHQQLLLELKGKPRIQIEVTSVPEGAEVVVDGRAVGRAPIVVRDLLPGDHFVALSREGERAERKVTAREGVVRVEERVGDPRTIAARALRTALSSTSSAEEILKKARALSDDAIVGALVPSREAALLVLARAHAGELQVVGARIEKTASIDARAEALAEALYAGEAGWIEEGGAPSALEAGEQQATPLDVLVGRAPSASAGGPPGVEDEEGSGAWVIVGVGLGAAAAVAIGVAGALLLNDASKRVEVTVDASKL